MTPQERQERKRIIQAERLADRPRLAAYLINVINDASDYEVNFIVPLTRAEIYTLWEALTLEKE